MTKVEYKYVRFLSSVPASTEDDHGARSRHGVLSKRNSMPCIEEDDLISV